MDKYIPSAVKTAIHTVYGYAAAHTLAQILRRAAKILAART
jgi:hypothetical protein